MEQWIGLKLGKEYIKAEYCHPAYLTYMQNTSCKMPGWMKPKMESRFLGEIPVTSDMQMTPLLTAECEEELKSLMMNVKEESEKAGLKLNVQKTKIMAPCYHSMANRWGNNGNSDRLYFLGLQNHRVW